MRSNDYQMIGIYLAQNAMVDLDGVRFVFLYEPAEQAPVRSFLHSAEHGTLDSIVVVKSGTRGHAGRVRKAARCAHWCLRCILVAARGQRRCVGVDSFLGFLEGVVSHGAPPKVQHACVVLSQIRCAARAPRPASARPHAATAPRT